jgi:hypothetical protein
VVQGHDLPLVVEDRRSRRARLGVGLVVKEQLDQVHDPVLPQRDLLLLAPGVLDDRHEVAHDGLALRSDQRVVAEWSELFGSGSHSHEREVELLIGQEEPPRIEGEHRGLER